ncbi:MAG TPA: hypothetical protein VMW38_17405, partial [Terriglobia bacterium]|nr:hypothetical protein [Terriglobia bacterium]
MASALQPTSILNLLPDEEFLDREADVQRLFHLGLDAARALTPSLFLSGPRKSGKSEILKRVYRRLFLEQETVMPFYHAVPKCVSSAESFCRDYFLRNIFQFLAFLKRDAELGSTEELGINLAFQLAYESKHPWLVAVVDQFHSGLRKKDLQVLSRLAIHFPLTAALNTGLSSFVIVDDFHHVDSLKSEEELALLSGDFLSALSSRRTPHLLSGFSAHALQKLFNTVEIPGNVVVYPLRSLEAQAAKHLLESLCERFGVALEPDLSSAIVCQLEYHPFYIRSLVEGARREEMQLQTPREFAEVYTIELTRGNLHLFFGSLLHSAKFSIAERMKALEVLHTCSRGTLDLSALHFFREENGGMGPDPERILETLRQTTLLEQGIGTITPITDAVLGDWIEWNFKHSLLGVSMTEAKYQVAANLLKRLQGNVQTTIQADRMKQVEGLLDIMDCQSVPVVLLDFSQFGTLEQIQDPQELSKRLHESEQMALPEMLSVTREETTGDPKAGFPGPVSVARGFEERRYVDDRETVWLVSYCPNELVGLNEILQFHDKCRRIARENRYQRIR